MMKRLIKIIKTFTLWELLVGLSLTLRYFFRKKTTLQYPEEETPISLEIIEGSILSTVQGERKFPTKL